MRRRWWLWLALLWAAPVAAHLTPNSEVRLGFARDHLAADIIIPQGEYSIASGNAAGNDAASLARASAYLAGHIRVHSANGAVWPMRIERIEFARIAGPPDLHAIARFDAPPGAAVQRLVIDWTAVIAALPGHFVLFVATSDFSAGRIDGTPHILGALQGARQRLTIDRGAPGLWRGFAAAVTLGMRHIADGRDHLLFLFALLLPAPLLAAGGRWGALRRWRPALWHVAGLITAFTIGHSATLVAAAGLSWRLPPAPVEVAIALTILVAAVHAWRPLFPGREAVVAAVFGLVHGLAFATAITGLGIDTTERALAIAGFNLGIEAVQLAVMAALLPLVMLALRSPHAAIWRTGTALLAGLAALGWVAARATGSNNPVATLADAALAAPWWFLVVAAVPVVAGLRAGGRRAAGQ